MYTYICLNVYVYIYMCTYIYTYSLNVCMYICITGDGYLSREYGIAPFLVVDTL